MLKRIFKKIGLSLLFAGVLSVGLSIKSASAITPKEQSKLLKAVQEVVKEKDNNYTYNAEGFWQEVSDELKSYSICFKGNTAYNHFSDLLKKKGISLENKGNYWTTIFKPYKKARTRDKSLTLEAYISDKIAKNSKYQINDDRIKRRSWTDEENEALYEIVEKYLKSLNGNPLPERGAWKKISVMCKGNEIFEGREINNDKIRSHFCKINFREQGTFNESSYWMTKVLNGFSEYISGNPQNPLSLKNYIKYYAQEYRDYKATEEVLQYLVFGK